MPLRGNTQEKKRKTSDGPGTLVASARGRGGPTPINVAVTGRGVASLHMQRIKGVERYQALPGYHRSDPNDPLSARALCANMGAVPATRSVVRCDILMNLSEYVFFFFNSLCAL